MNNIESNFVSYQIAVDMKSIGFDEPCFGWFILEGDGAKSMFVPEKCPKQDIGLCLAPTYSQCFRWFREKHNLIGLVDGGYDNSKNIFTYVIWNDFRDDIFDDYYSTYEEAEIACLKKLIEIVKDGK